VLSTLEQNGSRRWLTPKLAKGKLYRRRKIMAYGLIALLTALPLISINGKPAVLLDVPARQFTLFGYTFLPTDTALLALLMVAWFASIFLCTAVLGRAWCGWACPQTVYLEFVYRPIERLCLGRAGTGGKPKADLHPLRYALMYGVFLLISLVVTHTLLSYFVGVDQLRQWITSNPADHPAAFAVIVVSTLAVWFNFAIFREQMCIIACPYGRFQSVLVDRNSIGVRYDAARGEPRGRLRHTALPTLEPTTPKSTGDCVDCTMCAQVCPTGIDIRDGVQLECINCTQCIDACNAVMTKVGKPTGLIGFYSQEAMEGGKTRLLRPRVVLYSTITVGFLAALLILILTKQPFDAALVRNGGLPFFINPQGKVENTMRLTLRNRSGEPQTFAVASQTPGVAIVESSANWTVPPGASAVQPLHLVAEDKVFEGGKRSAVIEITANGHKRSVTCQLFGPGALQ
jgi:cytochrome c oxidase accessory protein FixG